MSRVERSDVKRFGVVLAAALAVVLGAAPGASAAPYTAAKAVKINVMGEWAHPDDDTSIIGPCGVWHAALRRQVRDHHGHPR